MKLMSVKGYYDVRRRVLAEMKLSSTSFAEDKDLWLFANTTMAFVLLHNLSLINNCHIHIWFIDLFEVKVKNMLKKN